MVKEDSQRANEIQILAHVGNIHALNDFLVAFGKASS
jgi:hypothetical protein